MINLSNPRRLKAKVKIEMNMERCKGAKWSAENRFVPKWTAPPSEAPLCSCKGPLLSVRRIALPNLAYRYVLILLCIIPSLPMYVCFHSRYGFLFSQRWKPSKLVQRHPAISVKACGFDDNGSSNGFPTTPNKLFMEEVSTSFLSSCGSEYLSHLFLIWIVHIISFICLILIVRLCCGRVKTWLSV